MSKTRTPPAAVARQLRQESGFGCAVCGCPILDYHHIIEWSELNHFKPEHMVALCPTHHREYGKLDRSYSYKVKQNPINLRNGKIHGYMGGHRSHKGFMLGSATIVNCDSVIDYSGNQIISYEIMEGQLLLDALLPNPDFWPEIRISKNQVTASIGGFWDIQFKTNWIRFNREKGNIFFELDFRGDLVKAEGQGSILGFDFKFSSDEAKIGNVQMRDVIIQHCTTAIQIGPNGRVFPPNYAMRNPAAIYLPSG